MERNVVRRSGTSYNAANYFLIPGISLAVTTKILAYPKGLLMMHWVPDLRSLSYRIGFSTALITWMALIFLLSALPAEQASRLGPYDSAIILQLGEVRSIAAHLALFGALAILIQATIWSWTTFTDSSLKLSLGVITLSFLYGVSDEFHQSFVYGRNTSVSDMLVNAMGATAAIASLQLTVKVATRSTRLPFGRKPCKASKRSNSE